MVVLAVRCLGAPRTEVGAVLNAPRGRARRRSFRAWGSAGGGLSSPTPLTIDNIFVKTESAHGTYYVP